MDAETVDALRVTLTEYLQTRRALGYTLARTEKLNRTGFDGDIDYPEG